jgi:hypothetical protein
MSISFLSGLHKFILPVLLSPVISAPVFSDLIQDEDSVIVRSITAEDLVRGERLFHGLVYPANRSVNCSGCHNLRFSDTLNWNPDAIEISKKYLLRTRQDLDRVLHNPSGVRMAQVHDGFRFTPEEVMLLKAYMDELSAGEIQPEKPVVTNLFLFIVASILLTFSIVDLMITKKIRKQWIHLVILSVISIFIIRYLVVEALNIGHSPGYEPDQPVKFSHAVHAGQNKTDCIYCHSYAPDSKSAGFPATNVCMNCHLIVRTGSKSGAFEIAKVIQGYEQMQPIEWIRVHNLPDHAFFSHAQHVSAGGIACQECHGPVQDMGRISLIQEMTMGWCIDCHRTRKVNFELNSFYSQYENYADKIKKGELGSVTAEGVGGTECMKCHY